MNKNIIAILIGGIDLIILIPFTFFLAYINGLNTFLAGFIICLGLILGVANIAQGMNKKAVGK